MFEFKDIIEFFVRATDNLRNGVLNLSSPLDEIVLRSVGKDLAYVDNRRDALNKYGFDFWKHLKDRLGEAALRDRLKECGIGENLKYSKSEQFPDFVFTVRRTDRGFSCGSLLELKDSEGGSIASFNSTLPTKSKNLEEVDVVNGESPSVVTRIAGLIDGEDIERGGIPTQYYTFDRKCFYLVRTHRGRLGSVKISLVDGAFFETVPKDHLIYQMLLQILHKHIERKRLKIPDDVLRQVEETLSHITDQSIIAASRIIENASVRPRLRIMAEVHSEGNPHSAHYPQIPGNSFNLILKSSPQTVQLEKELPRKISGIKVFSIKHMRNGEHIDFQIGLNS